MPGRKARPGAETEVDLIEASLSRWFCFGRTKKQKRLDDLLIDPLETIGAPVVGVDASATEWARQNFENRTNRDLDMDAWLQMLSGLRVAELARPSDGLPLFTNGGLGQYIGPESFRAQFLKDCLEIIGQPMLDSCYVEKHPIECGAFGAALRESGMTFATARQIDVNRVDESKDPESDEFHVAVVLSAGRWCEFWGRTGHGMSPWF